MNEIDIRKQSFNIQEIADNLIVCDDGSLQTTLEIIKAIRTHKNIVTEYWKTAKESAKKAYQEISHKEKEMLNTCEKSEKVLKEKILNYKQIQDQKYQKIIDQAEIERKYEVNKLLKCADISKNEGDLEEFENKIRQAEKLGRISLNLDLFQKKDKISTQKRFKCRITNNELVPAFFDGIEIREVNTKKLLEIRRQNPDIKIPGIEFYRD